MVSGSGAKHVNRIGVSEGGGSSADPGLPETTARPPSLDAPTAFKARNAQIRVLRTKAGWTHKELGKHFKISRQRVTQIIGIERQPTQGFVYLAKNAESDLVKIGCSRNPKQRSKALGANVKLFKTFHSSDMFLHEAEIHYALKDRNAGGEWFALREFDLIFISWFFELRQSAQPNSRTILEATR